MISNKIRLMGILNTTPDSFYDGGQYCTLEKAFLRSVQIKKEGADIIDVGGESTRPGAEPVSLQEELDRVVPVIERIKKELDILISVDTTKAAVAREAVSVGAGMINDISGLKFDPNMKNIASEFSVYLVLMHIRSTPLEMQQNTNYVHVLDEIAESLQKSVDEAIRSGVKKDKIIIDPGVGFGKTLDDNYRIIKNIQFFKKMGFPLLIGLSRKSLIKKLYNEAIDSLPGTIALNSIALFSGADIVRVHDVKEHRLMFDVVEQLKRV